MNPHNIFLITLAAVIIISIIWVGKITTIEPAEISDEERLLSIIALAESSNGLNKTGDNGKSIGIYQIGEDVLMDYNKAHHTLIPHKALYDDDISRDVAEWHMKQIIKQLRKKAMLCTARVVYVWNVGYSSMRKEIPKCHTNLVYDGVYQQYWRNMVDKDN